MKSLQDLAKIKNRTVIFSIHQPSSDIWFTFDRIMLLVEGKFIYQGAGNQSIIDYFSKKSFNCPKNCNPADYFMSIMHSESEKNRQNFPKYYQDYETTLQPIVQYEMRSRLQNEFQMKQLVMKQSYQVSQIAKRTFLQVKRNPMMVKARIIATCFMSIFALLLFLDMPKDNEVPMVYID